MFNTACWHMNRVGLGRLVAIIRMLVFMLMFLWVKTGTYDNPEQVGGWLGWKQVPLFGILAFIQSDGKLTFLW